MCDTGNQPDNNTYIAITIGPIFRTMSLTSSPAALWASSYLFSYIAKGIREGVLKKLDELLGEGKGAEMFISPYIAPDNQMLKKNKGYGLLHDHIIFEKPGGFGLAEIKEIRKVVLEDVNIKFAINDPIFLKKYVMITAVEYSADNPITGSGKMLDCAELAATFPPNENQNPILAFFTSQNIKDSRNQYIKKQGIEALGIFPQCWQLLKKCDNASSDEKNQDEYWNYQVKDLPTIALGGLESSKMKKHAYYAIVRSDGDNMGKLIGHLETSNQFHTFSDACLKYCETVSDLVGTYQGMTVYAGGDDLLAILPCEAIVEKEKQKENGEKEKIFERKTVFDFVREANGVFAEKFLTKREGENKPKTIKDILDEINEKKPDQEKLPAPSLTWGVTLCHHKYPLYEALEDSASLLFGAKGKDYKNALNLRLIKHSGQTSAVYIKNEVLADENGTFFTLLNDILGRAKDTAASAETAAEEKAEEQNNEILLSCLHTFREAQGVFRLADENNAEDLFINMFDADAHSGNAFLHESLPRLYKERCLIKSSPDGRAKAAADIYALDDSGDKVVLGDTREEKKKEIPDAPATLHYLLRILKFFVEKAGEKE